MHACMYVCIDSSARRPNHTSYDKKTAVVSNFRSSGYETKREQLTEVWEVSDRKLGREKDAQKHCARLLGTQFFARCISRAQGLRRAKVCKIGVFSPFLAMGGVRERSERAPGGGPGRVREGSEKCFERLRCRLISVVCPNRARELKKVCEPLEECADFWPELANYCQFLTIQTTARFCAQVRWF